MLACYYFLPYCREIVATGKVYQVRRRSGLDTFSWRVCGSCCVQPQPMASDLLLITNQFNKITLVHSISLVEVVKSLIVMGDTSLQTHVVMVAVLMRVLGYLSCWFHDNCGARRG